jgi:hypothetical protein
MSLQKLSIMSALRRSGASATLYFSYSRKNSASTCSENVTMLEFAPIARASFLRPAPKIKK